MRLFAILAIFVSALSAEGITIVLDYDGPHSPQTDAAMKHEIEGILRDATLTVDWRTREQAEREAVSKMVVVRLKGKCILDPVPYLYDERGPLAFTYATDGEIQPFGEIACDKVATAVRSAMFGGDYAKSPELFGKALGRVLAHEVVHMLTGSEEHGHSGIARRALSGSQLIAPELRLSPEDLERLTNPAHKINRFDSR